MKNKQKKKGLVWKILTPVFAVLTAVLIAAIPITQGYSDIISNALHAQTQKVEADPDAKIYYWTAWEDQQALVDHEYALCRQIEGEGAALLVNRDNTLPLPQGTKFTPFSQSSFNLIYGGTGSGSMKADDAVSLRTALIEDFGEGCFNDN